MASISIARRLLMVVAAALLPLAAMSGIALYALVEQQHAQAERATLELARALGIAVDAELRRSISVLEALTVSPLLDAPDLEAFDRLQHRVADTRPLWLAVNLADPSGRMLANTLVPRGSPLPGIVDRESFERVVQKRAPVVGNLTKGSRGAYAFAVRVPVMRNGELRYVLSAAVKPETIFDIISRQNVPTDWVISVFDAEGVRVARSRAHAQTLGTPAAPSLQKLMASGAAEATGITSALEGDQIVTAFSRLGEWGWTVAPGAPLALVNAGIRASVAAYGGGILLSIVLGGLAALYLARGIVGPMVVLRDAAKALGRGERPQPPASDIHEIREVGEALQIADEQRAWAEAEREQLLRREQAARASAEAANRAKDEFLAMLGHELRNPLGAIANATRLLEHPRTDAEGLQRARAIIGRQVDHLARMTDDLLDAGRAITGKIVLHRAPLDLAAAVAATLATLRPRTEHHRLSHELRSVWVEADATRIEQIVANLVINAVKYTPPGGTIRVSVLPEGGDAVLRVVDDGIGMSRELAGRVFELFVQGERDLDRALGGLGIGLTLVRRLAELHGGSAQAVSEGADRGSQFTVRLPAIPQPAASTAPITAAATRSRDILIVEDNQDARETLKQLLELTGHRVRAEPDGEAGLRAALAAPPDVALVDIGLPKMDGYELARRLREAERAAGRRTVLIAVTGYGLPEERSRALEAGFDDHLVKPVDETVLQALLASR